MLIFNQEKLDGIAESIKANACIAYEMVAKEVLEPHTKLDVEKVLAYQKKANSNQKDLYYLDTVLVSTNWNKNDDVFLPDRVWEARATAEDKQFNFMHNENDIIGHITGCYVVDSTNKIIDEKIVASDGIPSNFDIITESVIYKSWSDPKNQERINKIIAEIKDGLWYVSMECLFNGFDYAIIQPGGNSVLLERNEASAYLSKHLRAYGGTGEYEGYKVGRALREITFSGKGLVSKPANPRSIIKSEADFRPKEITRSFVIGEKNMENTEVLAKQLEETKAQLNKVLAENEQAKAAESKKLEETVKTLASEKADVIAKAEKTLADAKAEFETKSKAAQAELDAAKADLAAKTAELVKAQEALAKMEKDKKMMARKDKLVKAGFTEEDAEASLPDYDALSEESFDRILAKFIPFGKKDEKKDEKNEDKSKSSDDKDADEKKKKEYKSEASDSTFEDVKAKAGLSDAETDVVSDNRKALASWYENMVGVKQETSGDKK